MVRFRLPAPKKRHFKTSVLKCLFILHTAHLYRRLGYDCLNSITIRKDLRDTGFRCVRQEKLYDLPFEIRKKD